MKKEREYMPEERERFERRQSKEVDTSTKFVASSMDEVSDAMSRNSVTPSPEAILDIEGLISDTDRVLAEALSKVEIDDPELRDISLDTEEGFAKAAQVAAAKAKAVQKETGNEKAKTRLQEFADRIIKDASDTLSRYEVGKKALRLAPVVVLVLSACKPVESATLDVNTPTMQPTTAEVIPSTPTEEPTQIPTETSTQEPTQTPEATATPTLEPMYDGELADMMENINLGYARIQEWDRGLGFTYYEMVLNMTLVSERPIVIGQEPEDWGRENTVLENIWGFSLNGQDYLFRTYRIGADINGEDRYRGSLNLLTQLYDFPNLKPGSIYGLYFYGFSSDIPDEIIHQPWQNMDRENIMPNAQPILENMLFDTENQEGVYNFFRHGEIGDLPVDENGIVDLRQILLPRVTVEW